MQGNWLKSAWLSGAHTFWGPIIDYRHAVIYQFLVLLVGYYGIGTITDDDIVVICVCDYIGDDLGCVRLGFVRLGFVRLSGCHCGCGRSGSRGDDRSTVAASAGAINAFGGSCGRFG